MLFVLSFFETVWPFHPESSGLYGYIISRVRAPLRRGVLLLEPYVRVSPHTARADINPVLLGGSHGETLIPISAFILSGLLAFLKILLIDVGIHRVANLHMARLLHIRWSEEGVHLGTEFPFPVPFAMPMSVSNPSLALVTMLTHGPSEQGFEQICADITTYQMKLNLCDTTVRVKRSTGYMYLDGHLGVGVDMESYCRIFDIEPESMLGH